MKRSQHPIVLLGLLTITVSSGCQTFGTATVRGQSPVDNSSFAAGDNTKIRGLYHTPVRSAADEVQDLVHEHHNTDTYYYGPGGPGAGGPGSVTPAGFAHHGGGANCPPGYGGAGYCPPGGYPGSCPPGNGWNSGFNSGIGHDRFSYGYEVPNDLVYPPAGGMGGAVVYPYYTHKGPSDFFRQ